MKEQVKGYWESNVCDTKEHLINGETKDAIPYPQYSPEYFREIERRRIASQEFAQPELYRGKRVLEVGVGSGVDFVQWVRHGAKLAFGVDLTKAAINHVAMWLATKHIQGEYQLRVGDAENLSWIPDGMFDLVWSWGVLHHTPDTLKAIRECVKKCRPGGEIKLMLYNSRSILWLGARVLKLLTGKDIESPGTQAFTKGWVRDLAKRIPEIETVEVEARTCPVDLIPRYGNLTVNLLKIANRLLGDNSGFFMTIRMTKRSQG